MCGVLQDVATRHLPDIITNIPPSHTKSMTHSVLYLPWVWTWRPEHRFAGLSYSETPVMRDAVKCRNLVESAWYQKHWPLKFAKDTSAKGYYINEKGGSRLSTTIRSGITSNHFDDILVDDPQNPTALAAGEDGQAEVEKARFVWDVVLPSRRLENARAIVVMQRLGLTDLTQHILDQRHPCHHLMLPLHFDPARACERDWRTVEGELLAPERYTEESIFENVLSKLTPEALEAQYEQDPTAEGIGTYGDLSDFKTFGSWAELPDNGIIGVSIDGATSGRPTSRGGAPDRSRWAFTAWLRHESKHYLLDAMAMREDLPIVLLRFQGWLSALMGRKKRGWRPDTIVIEKKSTGEAAASFFPGLNLHGFGTALWHVSDSKNERAAAAMPPIREGRVFLPLEVLDEERYKRLPTDAYSLLRGELKTFPRGRTDDLVDSLNQILLFWQDKFGEHRKKPNVEQMLAFAKALNRG
jgi:hypothetical protein